MNRKWAQTSRLTVVLALALVALRDGEIHTESTARLAAS